MSHHHSGSSTPLTAEQIDDNIEDGSSPEDTPGANWSIGVDNSDVTEFDTPVKGLTPPVKSPASVVPEAPGNLTFDSMLAAFQGASPFVGSTQSGMWQDIGQAILSELTQFKAAIASLDEQKLWVGKTHDAAMANFNESLAEPLAMANGIGTLSTLLDAFTDTIFQTRWYFLNWNTPYQQDLNRWPHHADEVKQGFDSFARDVFSTVYLPNIQAIAAANPGFNSDQQPNVNTTPPPPNTNTNGNDNPPPPPPNTNIGPPPPADPGGPPPPPDIGAPNLNGAGGPNGANIPDLSNLTNAAAGLGNGGAGLSNLLGGPSGDGSNDGFDPSQLPGGSDVSALTTPGGSSDGFDPSQLPGGSDVGAPDLSQLNPSSLTDPNGAGLLDNLPGSLDGTSSDGASGLSGLGSLGSGLSGLSSLGSPSGGGPAGAANGAGGLGSQLGSALGPAADALKSATGTGQGGGAPGAMPGLDPKGLNAADGAGPGGARAGLGGPGLDPARPAGVPVAGLGKEPAVGGAGVPRMGVPGGQGAGGSGSGAPPGGGGGQRGPTGKEHKANKALRRKRNGELVIGEPDAVVPVIGDDGTDTEAPEPLAPRTTPPVSTPLGRRLPPAAGERRPGAEQLRAELEL